jgi:hypothetical protein
VRLWVAVVEISSRQRGEEAKEEREEGSDAPSSSLSRSQRMVWFSAATAQQPNIREEGYCGGRRKGGEIGKGSKRRTR